jgi:hypothetical protein
MSQGTVTRSSARLVVVSGVAFAVIFFVALALTPAHAPNSASSGAAIAHYAQAHRTRLLLSEFLGALSALPTFVFIAALYRLLRRAESDGDIFALTSLLGGVVGIGLFVISLSLLAAVAYRPDQDPAILRALTDASWITVDFGAIAFAAFVGAITLGVLRTRVLPSWSGWVGVPVALVTLIGAPDLSAGSGPFSPQGTVPLAVIFVFAVWAVAICVAAWRAGRLAPRPS